MIKAIELVDAVSLSKKQCPYPIRTELTDNFIGKPLPGYDPNAADLCIMTPKAAYALCKIQTYLNENGFSLLVLDAYRPLRTVKYFTEWFKQPIKDEIELARKQLHYPHLEKTDLPKLGYVAADVSRHCFGYAVDLTLMHLHNPTELNMGAIFDYFDPLSSARATANEIGAEAFHNRQYLTKIMQQFNFLPYEEEFWHFDYHEHEAGQPFDIPIDIHLKQKLAKS